MTTKSTPGPWTNGWGQGLTGPNTPSEPTVHHSLEVHKWINKERDTRPEIDFIPISVGSDTLAIVVGPNREANAKLVAAAPRLLEALKTLHDETAEYIRINNLGDSHRNRSMQMARDTIWEAEND